MKKSINTLAKAFAVAALPFVAGCVTTTGPSINGFMQIGNTKPEDRVAIAYSSEWSSIGYLKSGHGTCTATLVAPNVILTADHCIKNRKGNQDPLSSMKFQIVQNQRTIASANITAIRFPSLPASRTGSIAKDIVFLILDTPLGNTYGYDSMATSAPRRNSAGQVPVQQLGYTPKYGYMRLTGDLSCSYTTAAQDVGILNMDCNVYKGDSGGPVFAAANNSRGRVIVGVNSQAYLAAVTRLSYAASVIGLRPPTR